MSAERVDRDPRLVIVTWLVTRSLLLAALTLLASMPLRATSSLES